MANRSLVPSVARQASISLIRSPASGSPMNIHFGFSIVYKGRLFRHLSSASPAAPPTRPGVRRGREFPPRASNVLDRDHPSAPPFRLALVRTLGSGPVRLGWKQRDVPASSSRAYFFPTRLTKKQLRRQKGLPPAHDDPDEPLRSNARSTKLSGWEGETPSLVSSVSRARSPEDSPREGASGDS